MVRKPGSVLISLGMLLILGAAALAAWNWNQAQQASVSVESAAQQLHQIIVPQEQPPAQPPMYEGNVLPERSEQEYPAYVLNPKMEMPEETIDGQQYIGILEIPSLGLELPIISQWSYPALNIAPARYVGSAYQDDLVIAAHNFKSHFGRLNTLAQGDRVIFTDVDGNVFVYEAQLIETLRPQAVEEMCSGEWDLTLFTCTVGGKYRVTVRCSRVEDNPADSVSLSE